MGRDEYAPMESKQHEGTYEPFCAEGEPFQTPARRRSERRRTALTFFGFAMFLTVYTTALVYVSRRASDTDETHGGRIIRSPASSYVKHEIREIDYLNWEKSAAFFGRPSETVDSNWHRLVKYYNIGLDASYIDELGRANQGVRLPDGKYFASLMVYHHLHCLKHIYHALNPDYYADARPGEGQDEEFRKHTEHCLGALKEYVMCKADVTVETMLWSPKHSLPLHNVTSTHQCARWDTIEEYAMANNEDVFADGVLVHPKYGAVYKDRKPVNVF